MSQQRGGSMAPQGHHNVVDVDVSAERRTLSPHAIRRGLRGAGVALVAVVIFSACASLWGRASFAADRKLYLAWRGFVAGVWHAGADTGSAQRPALHDAGKGTRGAAPCSYDHVQCPPWVYEDQNGKPRIHALSLSVPADSKATARAGGSHSARHGPSAAPAARDAVGWSGGHSWGAGGSGDGWVRQAILSKQGPDRVGRGCSEAQVCRGLMCCRMCAHAGDTRAHVRAYKTHRPTCIRASHIPTKSYTLACMHTYVLSSVHACVHAYVRACLLYVRVRSRARARALSLTHTHAGECMPSAV